MEHETHIFSKALDTIDCNINRDHGMAHSMLLCSNQIPTLYSFIYSDDCLYRILLVIRFAHRFHIYFKLPTLYNVQ